MRPEELGRAGTTTVLVIEDDPVTQQQFNDVLKAEGYTVVLASDCEAGLQQLHSATVKAVLLDLHLPGTDGLECLRRIRATRGYERIPVVVITGDYFLDDMVSRQLSGLGARIYFKPVWPDELAQLTTELLESASRPDLSNA